MCTRTTISVQRGLDKLACEWGPVIRRHPKLCMGHRPKSWDCRQREWGVRVSYEWINIGCPCLFFELRDVRLSYHHGDHASNRGNLSKLAILRQQVPILQHCFLENREFCPFRPMCPKLRMKLPAVVAQEISNLNILAGGNVEADRLLQASRALDADRFLLA